MQVEDKLAAAYFEKFLVRVEVLPEYHKRKSYSDVIRESQEALELFIKALLRTMGVTPSFSHDPGKELAEVKDNIPEAFSPLSGELTRMSKVLRKERELSYYGAKDFIPTQEYSEQEAREVLEFLQLVAKTLKNELR